MAGPRLQDYPQRLHLQQRVGIHNDNVNYDDNENVNYDDNENDNDNDNGEVDRSQNKSTPNVIFSS